MSCVDLQQLPEECLLHILKLLLPSDVVRSSAVSKQFLTASESDLVWEKYLPSDFDDLISQLCIPLPHQQFTCKKHLFLHLCRSPMLFNNNTQSFGLDRRNGKKCMMLGARALEIEWGDKPQYWTWKSIPESRFPEIAELQDVCWLDIRGEIQTKLLSPNTSYGAYFVFKIEVDNYRGFDDTPVKVCVSELNIEEGDAVVKSFYLKVPEVRRRSSRRRTDHPIQRDDGWLEIEMGRYQVGVHGDGVVLEVTLREIEKLHWKSGLLVQGIQLRPLD